MAYVYILVSLKDGQRYIGSTSNLLKRLHQHNIGLVQSTKNRRPLKLHAYQELEILPEARILESKYKKSRGTYEKAIQRGILKLIGD